MFRILSIDGGGIKGAFAASALATLEKDLDCRVADHFDLITGTSTGGIIALGLGLGLSAQEILQFYIDKGPAIFPGTSLVQRLSGKVKQFILGPKHSHQVLRDALEQVFQQRRFGESSCRLVIPTYNAIGGCIFIMKTAHHERFRYDIDAPAVDVALATSAAPTYFAAARFPQHDYASYVDGGVWANCPVLVGVTEALAFLGQKLDDLDVLSIGATTAPFSIAEHADSSAMDWNVGLVDLMFEAQVQTTLAQAGLMLPGRLHRLNAVVKDGTFSLDDSRPERIKQLVVLGRNEAVKKQNLEPIRQRFLNGQKAAPFVPVVALKAV
ncbi:CBASS cGAMP-activated phospholipase [Ideonella sp. A 288]|uniref:CBASS cGAMP-activated phospholipase n=1 Tax=Ideonella sp. A 288 TaxID=1962181 RepID=UPI000B4BE08A|nr:CBASS cGAMP-activated phospholipase [Ideonella sp. A 288]